MYMPNLALLAAAAAVHGHFVLNHPTPIGFDDRRETEWPCGSFDPAGPVEHPTTWPLGGSYIDTLTTHPHADWEFNFARPDRPRDFHPLTPGLEQKGVGAFCETGIRVPGSAGDIVILQVVQKPHDETLFQCAVVKLVDEPAPSVSYDRCSNSTGVSAFWKAREAETPRLAIEATAAAPAGTEIPHHDHGPSSAAALTAAPTAQPSQEAGHSHDQPHDHHAPSATTVLQQQTVSRPAALTTASQVPSPTGAGATIAHVTSGGNRAAYWRAGVAVGVVCGILLVH